MADYTATKLQSKKGSSQKTDFKNHDLHIYILIIISYIFPLKLDKNRFCVSKYDYFGAKGNHRGALLIIIQRYCVIIVLQAFSKSTAGGMNDE